VFLDGVAHLAERQLDVLHLDAGLQLHGVEEHLGSEGDRNRVEHGVSLEWWALYFVARASPI